MEQTSNREWLKSYDKTLNRKLEKSDMSLLMKNEGSDFELLPEGTHIATCYLVVDLGNQITTYKGQESVKPQVLISWECTNELMQDGRPFVATQVYNAFFSEKANLRKHLESWRGRKFSEKELEGFDISKLLSAPCQVTITHSKGEKTYANVTAVTGLPKGVKAPNLINSPVIYDLDNPNPETFDKLPEWIQKKISGRVLDNVQSFPESENPAPQENEFIDDEILF